MKSYEQKLRTTLLLNAGFSALSGLTFLLFHRWIGSQIGLVQEEYLMYIGIGLLLFAGSVVWQARAKTLKASAIKQIIVQDGLWVVASALVIAFQWFGLNWVGYELIVAVALIVGGFGWMQYSYLKRVTAA